MNHRLSAVDLNRDLAASGTNVRVTTVCRRLLATGCPELRPAKKVFNSCNDQEKTWAKEHKDWSLEDEGRSRFIGSCKRNAHI